MKKSFLLAAFALITLAAPATFAKNGIKKQTPKQEAKAQKKQEKMAAKAEKKETKTVVVKKHHVHKVKKAA